MSLVQGVSKGNHNGSVLVLPDRDKIVFFAYPQYGRPEERRLQLKILKIFQRHAHLTCN